mgnify:CR=1 FL=1
MYCIGTIPLFYNFSGTKCPAYSGENVSSTRAMKVQLIDGGIYLAMVMVHDIRPKLQIKCYGCSVTYDKTANILVGPLR